LRAMRLLRRFSAWLRLPFDVLSKIDRCGFGLCAGESSLTIWTQ
jgi:hypothetical protein